MKSIVAISLISFLTLAAAAPQRHCAREEPAMLPFSYILEARDVTSGGAGGGQSPDNWW